MRFHICRTRSNYDDDGNVLSPHPAAFKAPCVIHHCRTCSEDEFNAKFAHDEGLWQSKGRNHRTYARTPDDDWDSPTGICRDEDDEDWFIEIEDVLTFVREHGSCVIGPWYRNSDIISVEIYDGYRE